KSKAAVHLCFGNYGGESIQKSTRGELIEDLNALKADHPLMEGAPPPPPRPPAFQDLRGAPRLGPRVAGHQPPPHAAGGGVARAIERADKVLGKGRVKYVHPDCGFWMLKRNIADGKIRALVKGRDLYEGRG